MGYIETEVTVEDVNKIAGLQSDAKQIDSSVYNSFDASLHSVWDVGTIRDKANLGQFVLDVKIYGADTTKTYGIELVQFNKTSGTRSFIGIRRYNDDGTNGERVCLFDNRDYTPPPLINGKRIATLLLEGSDIEAVMTVDWEALPTSGDGWDGEKFYLNSFTKEDAEFNHRVVTDKKRIVRESGTTIYFSLYGHNAKVVLSDGYSQTGEKDYLILLFHGNGQDETLEPSPEFVSFAKANKISYAVIAGQDEVSAPFTTNATGWGNYVYNYRYKQLYDYLMSHYNFHSSVILAGSSMGGLTMGNFAYNKQIPTLFCLGIGPVPSLEYIFINGGDSRKEPIRQAYGMADDGSDDDNLKEFIQGYDWFSMGLVETTDKVYKLGFPPMYLYLGTGDTTSQEDFGGIEKYTEIQTAIKNAGGLCTVTDIGDYPHNDPHIWDVILADNIFLKELGISS